MSQLVSVSSPASGRELTERYSAVRARLRSTRAMSPPRQRVATPEERILREVEQARGFTVRDMRISRNPDAVHARQEVSYRCHVEAGTPLARLAAFFGRDHRTIGDGIIRHSRRFGLPVPVSLRGWSLARPGLDFPVEECPPIETEVMRAIRARLLA